MSAGFGDLSHRQSGWVSTRESEGIITPEAVVLELDTAGIASRLFSGVIDALAQAALYLALLVIALLVMNVAGSASAQVQQAVFAILLFVVIFGYPLVSEMVSRGRTLGKAAMGLRVVTIEGAPIRFRHAALRAMGGLVDKWIPPGGLVGIFFVLGTPNRQRIGDLLAGTIVIRDPDRTALPSGIWFPVPAGFEGYAASIDPTAFTVDQHTVVRSYLLRIRELTPAARYAVALDLADRTALLLRHQRPQQVHPETFLLCVIARYQRRAFPSYQPTAWNPHR
ncbi:MAG: RDD family protein [Ilumatobacteraceae bacterium]